MTNFIKLTEANGIGRKILLNVDFISTIQAGNTTSDVYIRMVYQVTDKDGKIKSEYYFVKEKFEEIELMIKKPFTAPENWP